MKFLFVIVVFSLFLASCRKNRTASDPSFSGGIKIIRFDSLLFTLEPENPDLEKISSGDRRFFNMYSRGVIQLGDISAIDYPHLLSLFLTDTVIREIYDTVRRKYPDLRLQEEELGDAFSRYHHFFPEKQIPRIYAHISGFNQSVVVDSALIGISLDNYLGEDCIFYKLLATPIPVYMRRKMNADRMVYDVLYGWVSSEFPFRPQKTDLLSGLIYQGKIVWLLKELLPRRDGEYLFGYTPGQLQWCRENERGIWAFLVENEYLFENRQMLFRKYLYDAPFSSGMPVESPGKAVVWSGYRIVEKYMKNGQGSLRELMEEQDYHKILRIAAYRP